MAGSILSVESNQNVQPNTKNVEPKTGKCGVQNSILLQVIIYFEPYGQLILRKIIKYVRF